MKESRLRSMLCNALCGLDSRYSDFDGWYLWGCVLRFTPALDVDLIPATPSAMPLTRAVARTCLGRLQTQFIAHGLPLSDVSAARVTTPPMPGGVNVRLDITMRDGKTATAQRLIQAHPHNPRAEIRSLRREPA